MNAQTGKQRFITYLTLGADIILKEYELPWKLSKITEFFYYRLMLQPFGWSA